MEMRKLAQRLLAAATLAALTTGSAFGAVADLRALVATESSIQHQYSFEGASDAVRQQDKIGSLNLSVSSYGTGASLSYTAGFDGTTTVLTPGVTSTAGQALTSGTASLGTTVTIEALIAPDGSVGADNQYAVTAAGGNRGYFMLQREGDLKTAVGGLAFSDGNALRDYTSSYTVGDWYYMVGTFQISGPNTVFNSWVANLSDASPALVKTNDNVTITGTFPSSSGLGIGMFYNGTTEAFDGAIDEVAVYNAALDDFTVQRHYSALTGTSMVIYREIFPNDIASDRNLSETGWQIHKSTGAAADAPKLSLAPGDTTGPAPVNSNPARTEVDNRGMMISLDNENGVDYIHWTDEYTVNLNAWDLDEISWYQSHSNTSDLTRVAIQLDAGQWYISDQTFTNAASHVSWELKTLDWDSATWRLLDFDPESSLATGASATLSGNVITAFGLYSDNKSTGRLRYDSFTITGVATAVPTPAALPAGLMLMTLVIRRRRG